jgi:hypothetical protein
VFYAGGERLPLGAFELRGSVLEVRSRGDDYIVVMVTCIENRPSRDYPSLVSRCPASTSRLRLASPYTATAQARLRLLTPLLRSLLHFAPPLLTYSQLVSNLLSKRRPFLQPCSKHIFGPFYLLGNRVSRLGKYTRGLRGQF